MQMLLFPNPDLDKGAVQTISISRHMIVKANWVVFCVQNVSV